MSNSAFTPVNGTQPASASASGVVTTGAQTFAGVKTFSSAPVIADASGIVAATASVPGTMTTAAQNFGGVKTFNDGIKLSNAAGQNVFSWYEEGTWTPAVGGSVADFTTVTYTFQVGTFTRIGRVVYLTCYVNWSNTTGTANGQLRVTGLPYAAKNQANLYHSVGCGDYNNIDLPAGYTGLALTIAPAQTHITFAANGDNIGAAQVLANSQGGAVARYLAFTLFYIV